MTTGILVVDKPTDWTSHDVIAKLRGVFREKKLGHSGTLDPMATGVLPLFFGRATRVVEFATETCKEYIAGCKLGETTDTQDITGTVISSCPQSISPQELEAVLTQFRGDLQQIPPMYSAIKIKGKKLYELARKGQVVERAPRPITIHELELLPQLGEDGSFLLRVRCSKGTYVRTLCHDIGAVLGCGAVMSSLRRTEAAGYTLSQAHSLEDIIHTEIPQSLLLPIDSYFKQDSFTITPWQEKKLRNGMNFSLIPEQSLSEGEYRIYSEDKSFLGLGSCTNGEIHCIKSFFEVVSQ